MAPRPIRPHVSDEVPEFVPSSKGPLKHGKHRSCTDVCCLLLFIVFLGSWGVAAYYAYWNGDPEHFLLPRDSEAHVCGRDVAYKGKPNLFFFDLTKCFDTSVVVAGCKTPQVCVASCPSSSWAAEEVLKSKGDIDWAVVQQNLICLQDNITRSVTSRSRLEEVVNSNQCAKYYIAMDPFYKRCVPSIEQINAADSILRNNHVNLTSLMDGTKTLMFLTSANHIRKVVVDEAYRIRYYLGGGVLVAVVATLIYILLLRYVAYILVWFSILATFVALGFGIYYCFLQYKTLDESNHSLMPAQAESDHYDFILTWRDTAYIQDKVRDMWTSRTTWRNLGILCSVLFVIFLLLVMFLRPRIRLAIALIGEASVSISSIKSSLVFPLFPWTLHIVVVLFSILVGFYIYSLEDSVYKVTGLANDKQCMCDNNFYKVDGQWCNPTKWNAVCHATSSPNTSCAQATCKFINRRMNNFVTYLFFFNIFAYFWSSSFISALSEMILAATFATWYWTYHKRDVPFFTVTSATYRTIRYHLGTLAFGSLIISICKFIRFLLEYIEKKCKKFDNGVTRAILWTLKCLFWCLHKFIAFVNKNAYIMCAIHGGNFCESAKDAFDLLVRNAIRIVVVDRVTDLLLFLGKVSLTVSISAGAYYVFYHPVIDADTNQKFLLEFPWAPVAFLGIVTYLISTTFFHVYSMAVDTLFLCFLEDCELNDSSQGYYMSKRLMKLLSKRNVANSRRDSS